MPSGTFTSFGRYQKAEPLRTLARLHLWKGEPLTEADWEPKIAVLDQEDLEAQGIDTSALVPGAPKVDALGSCTSQTTVEQLSNVLSEQTFLAWSGCTSFADTLHGEEAAIKFYAACTSQPGQSPWPPNDSGSDGPDMVTECETQKLIGSDLVASTLQDVCSLMQTGCCAWGTTWMNSWMTPGAGNFLDGNGTPSDIEAATASGVAGGHEITLSALVQFRSGENGLVIPESTIFRVRNHWDASWGDNGSCFIHGSTLAALFAQADIRQFVPVTA